MTSFMNGPKSDDKGGRAEGAQESQKFDDIFYEWSLDSYVSIQMAKKQENEQNNIKTKNCFPKELILDTKKS